MSHKIVITGGPSGGKTTLIEALQKEMGAIVAVVPEAASILYRGGFPRIKSQAGLFHAQHAIYQVQQELEELIEAEHPKAKLIICDRGSLDSIAYWPKSENHFFKTLKTTRRKELLRYRWVICRRCTLPEDAEHERYGDWNESCEVHDAQRLT